MTGEHDEGGAVVEGLLRLARETAAWLRAYDADTAADRALLRAFTGDLEAVERRREWSVQRGAARPVRALRHLPVVFDTVRGVGSCPLVDAALAATGLVRWSEFYQPDDWSGSFVADFANGEGIGPDGRLRHDQLILGLFLLGPETTYPSHAHRAEEFYLCLHGAAEFEVGAGAGYRPVDPGDVVIHRDAVAHSIRTSTEPFFSVFAWRGDLHSPSWYRTDMSDLASPTRNPTILKD